MILVTAEQMRELDRYTIEQIGLPAAVLMENAGRAIAEAVLGWISQQPAPPKLGHWLILAGRGNNGGDGLVAARHLNEAGVAVTVMYAEPPEGLSGDAALQRDVAKQLGLRVEVYARDSAPNDPNNDRGSARDDARVNPRDNAGSSKLDWQAYDGIIDALLGTGTTGAPRGAYASLIQEANGSGLPIISADIPSGLDADTGMIHEPCIKAVCTVALAFSKIGLALYPGREAAGQVKVAAIGIPVALAQTHKVDVFSLDEATVRQQLEVDPSLPRVPDSHKGTYGHLLVAAGSRRMAGAAILCVKSALRSGCGLATWALPSSLSDALVGRIPEVMLAPMLDREHGEWDSGSADILADMAAEREAVVVGPGLGRFDDDCSWLQQIWEKPVPLVIDADALNILADAADWSQWKKRDAADAPVVLTPHPGEMARLAGCGVADVQRDRVDMARSYAVRHGVHLVLKGAATVVAAPSGRVYINTTGNPGMATGGSGDVLAGIIGSLLAQGWDAEKAAAFGVWWHGTAGDRAAASRATAASLLAGDIIDHL